MGKLLAVNHLLASKNPIQKKYRPTITVGPVSLSFVTLILILVLAIFYLTFATQLSAKGYELEKIQQKKAELLAENEKLEIEAARLQSLRQIEEISKDSKMIPSEKIYYANSQKQETVASR